MKRLKHPLLLLTLLFFVLTGCQKEMSFENDQPTAPGSSGSAVFTLSASSTSCVNANVLGTYTQGTKLTASNSVEVEVNVTTAGSWKMNTASVGGFYFSGGGTFASTGLQTITLVATGTPNAAGTQTFNVVAGSSACSFQVTVEQNSGGNPPAGSEYFPLTKNSWWSYDDASSPGDTIRRESSLTSTIAGNSYKGIITSDGVTPYDTAYYRKAGNNYYEYTYVDNLTLFTFDQELKGDILFLKEGLSNGATWNSAEWSGTSSGQAFKLRYVFSCIDANGTATINGKNYTNIYKIKIRPQVQVSIAPWTDTQEEIETWFAKGVGYIYLKFSIAGSPAEETNIRNYKIF